MAQAVIALLEGLTHPPAAVDGVVGAVLSLDHGDAAEGYVHRSR